MPDEFLSAIFDEIHNNEIVMEEEQAGQFAALAVGWGAGDLVNDRTRMEMYRKEMALIQKKSQMLIKAAFGGAKGGTASSASQQMVFRTAVHADLARPMFAMASWPMMATFSLLFEAADDTDDSDFSKATADSGLDNSPLGKSGSAESTKVADLCLQGFAAAIRVASLFKMETERDAFVSSLAKMTGLSHVSEMRMKNVAAIQTLIALASILGEYLESSWDDVLKIASSVERLQLAWNTAMDNMSGGNDGKLAGGMVGGSNAPINETVSSLKRTPGDGRRPIERRGSELLSPGASLLLPRRSVSYVRSDDLVMALSNGKLVNPTLQKVLSEISSQSMAISVDKIFSDTVQLSSSAIIHFFKAMCLVSLEEVGLESASAGTSAASTPLVTNVAIIGDPRRSSISSQSSSYRDNLMSPPPLSAGSAAISAMTGPPRMYLLQKIVEIAYYNIHRIRFEWSQIWRILQPHFNTVACHPNFAVATFAVDSLRQLSMKFLERDELSHYSTQHEFLRNFEWIMRHNVHTGIRELILSSLTQMMGARASNIKSGWKCIFTVLCKAATPPGHVAARGDVAPPPSLNLNGGLLMTFKEWERLAQLSFNIFESCFEKYFEVIIRAGAFVDYVSTLAEFVLLEGSGQVHDEIVSSSLKIGAECGKWLINQAEVENRNSLTSRGTSLSLEHISNSTNSTSIQNNESESSIGLSPVDGGDGGAKFIRRESAANAFSMVARQLMSPYLQPNGLISEDHFFLKWFPLLSSLGRIINDSENETVRNQTIENLFETLKAAAYLFETKYWKQIHRSIILPIFEDFKESSLRRGSVTTTGGAIGGGSAALTTSQQLRDSANSSSWLLAIQHLVELYTDIFDRITGMSNSGMDIVHSVFDLVISLLSKRDERLAATGQVCLEQFIQKNIGKLVVLGGGGAESRLWEIFTHGIERAAWTTLPAELLNCDSAVGSSSNGEGGSLHSRRPTFDSSSSYSAPTTIDGNDQHPQQQVQDPPAANTSTDSSTSTHPLPLDNSPMTIPPSATRTALRLAQSVAEGKNAAIRALTLGTERLDDVVPITSLDDLDFEHTIVKCGTHLEFVDAVRTICLTRVVATSSNNNEDEVAGASYSGTKKKRGAGQHAATHLADIGEDELMDARLVVNQSDDSLNNAANNTITSSATSTTTPSTARPPYVINLIPSTYRARWLRCVYDSYTFARAFNENFDVRKAILKKRLVKQMPNLVKQETTSCATYIELLFAIYKYQGDEEEDNAGVIVKQEHHQPSLSSPSSTTILSTLLREVIDVLERYVEYLQDQQRNQRDVGLWSPVVVVILRELVKTRSLWTTSGSTSISPITVNGVTAATGGLEESLINKYIGLSRSLPSLFLLGARMIRTDRPEVRQVLQDFIVAGLQVKIE